MNRRDVSRLLLPTLAALSAFTVVSDARAHLPDAAACVPAPNPGLTTWPLWERPNPPAFPADIETAGVDARTGIWNSFGEYQRNTGDPNHPAKHYMHTGIDLNAEYDFGSGFGDWVVAAAPGYIWGLHNMHGDACVNAAWCKIYIRSNDHRYIYYYAHLKLRNEKVTAGAEFDSEMRARIQTAAAYTGPDMPDYSGSQVDAGEVIAGIGSFGLNAAQSEWAHLHFSVLDACQNHDGLSPLDFLSPPGYVDDQNPVVAGVHLVEGDVETTPVDKCATPVTDPFDIVADVRDIWKDVGDPKGNRHLGVHRGTYRLTNLTAQDEPMAVVWYDFTQMPFQCAGPARGANCPVILSQNEILDELNLKFAGNLPNNEENGGPYLGWTFSEFLFRVFDPNNLSKELVSQSWDFGGVAMKNYAILNNEWGVDGDAIDPANLPDGLYQVVAEVFDQRGLAGSNATFFVVDNDNDTTTADLVIPDSEFDDGSIPSNAGGKKHWRSTNIKVGGAAPGVNDAVWNDVQTISVQVGVPTKVHVKVENHGCDPVEGVELTVGSTKASMISTNWIEIGTISDPDVIIPAGGAEVFTFDWEPVAGQAGHRCMLAAVNADEDPTKVPLDGGGDMDFTQLDEPSAEVVPLDSNLTQRNITVTGSSNKFLVGNPFGVAIDFGLELDCNDLPIDAPGATLTLHMDQNLALQNGWTGVDRVTVTGGFASPSTQVAFSGCKIELPAVNLPANTLLDAWVDVNVPNMSGTWDIDLKAKVNGVLRDGISVRHTQ